MEDTIGALIPILITLGAFTMVILLRRIEHVEKLKMIEKGIDFTKNQKKRNTGGTIKFASTVIGVGVGLLIVNALAFYTKMDARVCYFSMIFLFGGLGLIIGNTIVSKNEKKQEQE